MFVHFFPMAVPRAGTGREYFQSMRIIFYDPFANIITKLFASFASPFDINNTTILVTKRLIINLYHIIIPLTAEHKIHILTAKPRSPFCILSATRPREFARARSQKQLQSRKPKPQLKIRLEGKFIRQQHGAEIPRKLFQFSNALVFLSLFLTLVRSLRAWANDTDLFIVQFIWPPKVRKRIHSTRD